jgi:hypothetical protein
VDDHHFEVALADMKMTFQVEDHESFEAEVDP